MTPGHAWFAQGLTAQAEGQWTSALLAYRRALREAPDLQDAWINLATVLNALGRSEEALEAAAQADGHPRASLLRAQALQGLGQHEDARALLEEVHATASEDPALLSTLAASLHALGEEAEALALDLRALALDPERPELRLNAGYGLMRAGRLDEATAHFETLPQAPRARWNLAYARSLQGRLSEAWPLFGARLEIPEARENLRPFEAPRWDGRPFPGRTLLVWGEQGYGDALMAARFLPAVKALAGRVLVLTYPALVDLVASAGGADAVLPEGAELPPFDLQVPLLDLPALLAPADLCPALPYLHPRQTPAPALVSALEVPGRRLGLVWAGNPRHVEDRRRSLDPARLAPLLARKDLTWFSLQVGASAPPGMVDLAPHLHRFEDTAWALAQLDALVTVDTAVAHLAGALGRPVHLLLPHFPDWRWGFQGTQTPWYPTATLHRQPRPGDWDTVIRDLAARL